jgi:glutathione S-transferase
MAKITLYGVAASRALRNIWMLEEIGLPYAHDPIHYTDPALKLPPYIGLNPNGKIPMLTVDNFAVFESLAINLYLADRFDTTLSLKDADERGQASQWALWAMTEIDAPIGVWAMNTLVKPEAERDLGAAATALASLQKPLSALNTALSGKQCLVGDRFTVVDLNTAACLYRGLSMDLAAYPNVSVWLKRCWSREPALRARRARGDKV